MRLKPRTPFTNGSVVVAGSFGTTAMIVFGPGGTATNANSIYTIGLAATLSHVDRIAFLSTLDSLSHVGPNGRLRSVDVTNGVFEEGEVI